VAHRTRFLSLVALRSRSNSKPDSGLIGLIAQLQNVPPMCPGARGAAARKGLTFLRQIGMMGNALTLEVRWFSYMLVPYRNGS